jgi:hypothetical protein
MLMEKIQDGTGRKQGRNKGRKKRTDQYVGCTRPEACRLVQRYRG